MTLKQVFVQGPSRLRAEWALSLREKSKEMAGRKKVKVTFVPGLGAYRWFSEN